MRQPSLDVEGRSSLSSENNNIDADILNQLLNSRLRLSDSGGSGGSSDRSDQSSRLSLSQSSIRSLEVGSPFSSPCSSFTREEVRESGLELLALPQTKSKDQGLSPPSVLVKVYHCFFFFF